MNKNNILVLTMIILVIVIMIAVMMKGNTDIVNACTSPGCDKW